MKKTKRKVEMSGRKLQRNTERHNSNRRAITSDGQLRIPKHLVSKINGICTADVIEFTLLKVKKDGIIIKLTPLRREYHPINISKKKRKVGK